MDEGRPALDSPPHPSSDAPGGGRPTDRTLSLTLDVRTVSMIVVLVTAVLVVLDFVSSAASAEGARQYLTRFFNANEKVNFPTGFKTTMLLILTVLLAAMARRGKRDRDAFTRAWWLLAAVSAFAFIDELVYLHQTLSAVLHDHYKTGGALTFAWTLVYVPALVAVGVIVVSYMRYLSSRLRARLLLGGVLYGLGAVCFEPIKSHFADHSGQNSLAFQLVAAVSDSLEMIGLALLVIVLLTELASHVGRFDIALRARAAGRH
jgi:hypothetical protein